jgi:hypothetical protein
MPHKPADHTIATPVQTTTACPGAVTDLKAEKPITPETLATRLTIGGVVLTRTSCETTRRRNNRTQPVAHRRG